MLAARHDDDDDDDGYSYLCMLFNAKYIFIQRINSISPSSV